MKKSGTFVLATILLIIGVVAVLCVTYPALQQKLAADMSDFGEHLHIFFEKLAQPFREAFLHG